MIAVEKTVSQPELDPSNDLKSKLTQNGGVENNTVEVSRLFDFELCLLIIKISLPLNFLK